MLWKCVLMLSCILCVGWSVHAWLAVPPYTKHFLDSTRPPRCRPLLAAKDGNSEKGKGGSSENKNEEEGWVRGAGRFVSGWFQGDDDKSEAKKKKKQDKKASKEKKKQQKDEESGLLSRFTSKMFGGDKDTDSEKDKKSKRKKKKRGSSPLTDLSDSSLFVGPKMPFTSEVDLNDSSQFVGPKMPFSSEVGLRAALARQKEGKADLDMLEEEGNLDIPSLTEAWENLEDKVLVLREKVNNIRGAETPEESQKRLAEEKKQLEKIRKQQEEKRKQQQKEEEKRKQEEQAKAQAKKEAEARAAEKAKREAEARREEAKREKERQERQKKVQKAAASEQEPEKKPGLGDLLPSIKPLQQEEAPEVSPTKRSGGSPFLSVVQKFAKNVLEKKEQWIAVLPKTKIAPGGIVPVEVAGLDLVLIASRDGQRLHCVANSCPHLGTPLETGLLVERPIQPSKSEQAGSASAGVSTKLGGEKKCEDCIVCPLHRTAFELDSGEVRGEWCPYPPVIGKMMGAVKEETPLVVFDVRTKGKNIEVRISSSLDSDAKDNKKKKI